MSSDFDLIAIGSGTASAAAATKCAKAGWRVAVVDDLPFGGTCALRGCDPKKILRRGAEVIDAARLLEGKGIVPGSLTIDWPAVMAHKRGFTEPMSQRIEKGLVASGVTALHGLAVFTGPGRLSVDGVEHTASHFLIGTGARPRTLEFPGAAHVIDSTAFLELDALPKRILFVGGGFISFEFAHIAARAGSEVTIVHRSARPLRRFDPDLVALLVQRSRELGIDIRLETEIAGIEPAGARIRVQTTRLGESETLEVELVVHGAGRVPDLDRLNLDAAGIAHDEHGVSVHPHLQSVSNPRVYAAGDAAHTQGQPLTPVAAIEGKVAASNMLKDAAVVPDYTGIPTAVFTVPELAAVGLLEDEVRAQGIDVDVRYSDTSAWFSNYRIGEPAAAAKILIDRATDRIVGAHLFGPEYAELVNTIALAMKTGLSTRQVKSMTAAYPSVGSDLGSLL
ncbi:dihydrolipoyl dehydrogenase family protein [Leifsonia sp. L25]|uniref:dihydrolipoyl dehydrogenase family protein n=1 Tax=Actinomycetes TaxID=1760 RepID=UPI003D699233